MFGCSNIPPKVTCNMSQVLDSRGFAGPCLTHEQHRLPFADTHSKLFNENRGWPSSSKSKLLPTNGKKELRSQAGSGRVGHIYNPSYLGS
jgi:hypothetical protein